MLLERFLHNALADEPSVTGKVPRGNSNPYNCVRGLGYDNSRRGR